MLRKKHSEPEIREAMIKVGDEEIGIPYRPGQLTTVPSGISVFPKWFMRLLHLAPTKDEYDALVRRSVPIRPSESDPAKIVR